jgi:hypothetical protein
MVEYAIVLAAAGDPAYQEEWDRRLLLVRGRGSTPVLHRMLEVLAEAVPDARVREADRR